MRNYALARAAALALYAIFWVLLSPGSLRAQETLKLVGIDKIAPMSWIDRGRPAGFICDLINEVGKRTGFEAQITLLPFRRALKMLQSGEADGMISLHYKEGREVFAIYPKTPLYNTRYCVFVKKEKTFVFRGIEDLYGKRVGKLSGWFLGKPFDDAVKSGQIFLEQAPLLESNLRMLMLERIDAYLGTYFATHYEIQNLGLKGRITALPRSIREESVYLVISRNTQRIRNKPKLIERIDAAIFSLREEKQVDRIAGRYMQ